jgi:alpha-D-xyloside xylohydrolase
MIFTSQSNDRRLMRVTLLIIAVVNVCGPARPARGQLQGHAVDVSDDFQDLNSTFFVADRLSTFDEQSGTGSLRWSRHVRRASLSFNKLDTPLSRGESSEFPSTEYDRDPALPFEITFLSPRTVRIRCSARAVPFGDGESPMLVGKLPQDHSWKVEPFDGGVKYTSSAGQVRLIFDPWHLEFYDASNSPHKAMAPRT